MEIRNSLIVTNDQSVLRLRMDEVQNFSGNLVVHEDTLSAWLSDPEGWNVPVNRSADDQPTAAQTKRAAVNEKIRA